MNTYFFYHVNVFLLILSSDAFLLLIFIFFPNIGNTPIIFFLLWMSHFSMDIDKP